MSYKYKIEQSNFLPNCDLSFLQTKYYIKDIYDEKSNIVLSSSDLEILNEIFIKNFFIKDVSNILKIKSWQKNFFTTYPDNLFYKLLEKDSFYLAPIENIINLIEVYFIYIEDIEYKKDLIYYSVEFICSNLLYLYYMNKHKKHKLKLIQLYNKIFILSKEYYLKNNNGINFSKTCLNILSFLSIRIRIKKDKIISNLLINLNLNLNLIAKDLFFLIDNKFIINNHFKQNPRIFFSIFNSIETDKLINLLIKAINYFEKNNFSQEILSNIFNIINHSIISKKNKTKNNILLFIELITSLDNHNYNLSYLNLNSFSLSFLKKILDKISDKSLSYFYILSIYENKKLSKIKANKIQNTKYKI